MKTFHDHNPIVLEYIKNTKTFVKLLRQPDLETAIMKDKNAKRGECRKFLYFADSYKIKDSKIIINKTAQLLILCQEGENTTTTMIIYNTFTVAMLVQLLETIDI